MLGEVVTEPITNHLKTKPYNSSFNFTPKELILPLVASLAHERTVIINAGYIRR